MNYLYYSLDDGTIAYQTACKLLEGKPMITLSALIPGRILKLGYTGDHSIFVCGVGKAEFICKLTWVHALEQNGQTNCEWYFIKVQNDE
jgi:hypothetical protein